MEIEITVNDAAVRQLLNTMPQRFNRAMRSAMTDANTYLLRQVRRYPPTRTMTQVGRSSRLYSRGGSRKVAGRQGRYWASTYRRTGTLGRSWHALTTGTGDGISGGVRSSGTIAPYNFRVQGPLSGEQHQAWMHRGRWDSVDEIRERSTRPINEMFRARIDAAMR